MPLANVHNIDLVVVDEAPAPSLARLRADRRILENRLLKLTLMAIISKANTNTKTYISILMKYLCNT